MNKRRSYAALNDIDACKGRCKRTPASMQMFVMMCIAELIEPIPDWSRTAVPTVVQYFLLQYYLRPTRRVAPLVEHSHRSSPRTLLVNPMSQISGSDCIARPCALFDQKGRVAQITRHPCISQHHAWHKTTRSRMDMLWCLS